MSEPVFPIGKPAHVYWYMGFGGSGYMQPRALGQPPSYSRMVIVLSEPFESGWPARSVTLIWSGRVEEIDTELLHPEPILQERAT